MRTGLGVLQIAFIHIITALFKVLLFICARTLILGTYYVMNTVSFHRVRYTILYSTLNLPKALAY